MVPCPVCGKPKADKKHLKTEHPEYFQATRNWRNAQEVSTFLSVALVVLLFIVWNPYGYYPFTSEKPQQVRILGSWGIMSVMMIDIAIALYAFHKQVSLGKEYRTSENSTPPPNAN